MRIAFCLTVLLMSGCSMIPAQIGNQPSPLVIASCPPLPLVSHHTFGDTVSALVDLYGKYHKCREAALAGQKLPNLRTE
jgi:hypothetical protein